LTLQLTKILLIPEKSDIERDIVARAYQHLGGKVQQLGKFWEKPVNLEGKQVAIYGNDTFTRVVAQVFNVYLISPDDALLAHLSQQWTKRLVKIKTIAQVHEADFPCFIKPVIPKQWKACVYQTLEEILAETQGLDNQTEALVSEIIEINAEARGFVLDDKLIDLALYEGNTTLEEGSTFLIDFLNSHTDLPKVFVADIGFNSKNGWFIIEFNACWGAGLNNCNPEKVLACILEATQS
jgi:hypothetical protein